MKDVNVLAVELIGRSKEVIKSAKELKNGFSFPKLMVLAKEVAKVVEEYTKEIGELSSDTKLALGIEILINVVDVPYVPQWMERKIYQIVLNKAVKYLQGSYFGCKKTDDLKTLFTKEDIEEVESFKRDLIDTKVTAKAKKEVIKKVNPVRSKLNKRLGR